MIRWKQSCQCREA